MSIYTRAETKMENIMNRRYGSDVVMRMTIYNVDTIPETTTDNSYNGVELLVMKNVRKFNINQKQK